MFVVFLEVTDPSLLSPSSTLSPDLFCKQMAGKRVSSAELNRLQDHMVSPPSETEMLENIVSGLWPGLEIKMVTLPSGKDIGLGVFAFKTFKTGCPVAHYPYSCYLEKDNYFNLESDDPSVANYAQEVSTSGLAGWRHGPIVLLAHDLPADSHYGHLINYSPCASCCNLVQTVKLIDGEPQLIFRAKRKIAKDEQLLRDYGDKYVWPDGKAECPGCGHVKETGVKKKCKFPPHAHKWAWGEVPISCSWWF